MIPTSIDGTDITGATIDGTDVTEITVDGQTVFSSATIVDDFETQNLNIWSGQTGSYTIDTSTVKVGTASLRYTNTNLPNQRMGTATGIERTPDAGDRHQVWVRPATSSNSQTRCHYASDSFAGRNDTYIVSVDCINNQFKFVRFSNGNGSGVASVNLSLGSQWFLIKMFHDTNGDYEHTLFDSDGTTQLAQLTGNDTTLLSGGSFDHPNVVVETGAATADRWDHWIITS